MRGAGLQDQRQRKHTNECDRSAVANSRTSIFSALSDCVMPCPPADRETTPCHHQRRIATRIPATPSPRRDGCFASQNARCWFSNSISIDAAALVATASLRSSATRSAIIAERLELASDPVARRAAFGYEPTREAAMAAFAITPNRLPLLIVIDGADGCGKSSLA
jgi:hypothetical protein